MGYYTIRIQDISEAGVDLVASSKDQVWPGEIVRDAVSIEIENLNSNVTARIVRSDRSVEAVGGIYIEFDVKCDKCLKKFRYSEQIPFRMLLEPAPKKGLSSDLPDEDMEDLNDMLDFSYYVSDEIDIGDMIRQHIVMAQPISHVCSEDCKGLCGKCGKNLNHGSCKCTPEEKKSPFSALKGVKIEQ